MNFWASYFLQIKQPVPEVLDQSWEIQDWVSCV